MYLPNPAYSTGPGPYSAPIIPGLQLLKDGSSTPTGGWSSLIGIITAICGNILISFALNTQRYAHIRLSRDRDEWAEKQKAEQRQGRRKPRTYGTQQGDIAEERALANAQSEAGDGAKGDYALEAPGESNEADPLIPHLETRKGSASSDDTVRPNEKGSRSPREKSYLQSPIWWLGISLMTLGEAGNFLAYGFAPASIVSPLGVVALVSNCMIAPLLLGERFRWRDGLGVIIAIAGAVTVVLSASDSNPRLTPDKIWHLITRWEFETYLGISLFLIIALTVASNKYGDRTVIIDLGLVGLFGGYTALSTKGIASLLSNTIWRVVTFPITYLLVAVLVFTAVMQIKYLNRALQHFNATIVIPTQFVIFTISVIVGSAILYRDFERQTPEDAGKFFGGCALTFLGVWCITSGRGDDSEGDEELGEDEDAIDLLDEEHVQPEVREREDGGDRRRSLVPGSSNDLQRLRTADSIPPSVIVTPDMGPTSSEQAPYFALDGSASQESLQAVSPANAAAIHSKSMTQLPQESEAATDARRPPPLHATTSAPVVPYAADLGASFRPRTPLNRNKSAYASDSPSRTSPTTPAARPGQYLDPNSSNRLLNRHSVVGLLPLTSPLSSSLSAIVADSLRRGVDSPAATMRRRRSSRGQRTVESSRRLSSAALKRHSIASGEMDFDDEATAELRAGAGSPQGRVRSLSATLSDLFGSAAAKRPRLESQESIQEQGEERQ
ncbi:hypothetical protein LTR36_005882 [Oleoguttula mirabilis]|uniref:DUF803-domain-containing protein n=1 Tax=Oleoguttula mirabilis TaxID=1507867 RepID=A0AAV9JDA3_9PEZI|nr:hypothetical protein LTR36_005882 [Oleoguttula mirabilis]